MVYSAELTFVLVNFDSRQLLAQVIHEIRWPWQLLGRFLSQTQSLERKTNATHVLLIGR